MSIAHAPGKAILFGEHAVVYGRPAIAVPINQVQARATVEAAGRGSGVVLVAPDIHWTCRLLEADVENPLRAVVDNTLSFLGTQPNPNIIVTVTSTIPMACGMGSGTAVSVSIIRALTAYFGAHVSDETVSDLAYEVEKIHHGTPSGIDNTVVTYRKPVYFIRGQKTEILKVGTPFAVIVADTGVCSPTRVAVGDVRENWTRATERYDGLFDEIGDVADSARQAIETGAIERLGPLMNENQRLLREIDVSSPELETLILAALNGGAAGAKLSGAGRGGNMIALISTDTEDSVEQALKSAGAAGVIAATVA